MTCLLTFNTASLVGMICSDLWLLVLLIKGFLRFFLYVFFLLSFLTG